MAEAGLAELFRAALADLAAGRADRAAPAVGQLLRAAPGDPRVRQLAQQAAVVALSWPGRREAVESVPRTPPSPDAIDLVSFHVDLPDAPSGLHAATDYMGAVALSFESARLRAPRARRILLTGMATPVPDCVEADEVRRCELDPRFPMLERMRLQREYLRSRPAGRATVLIDSDVVVNADPATVFDHGFDVGLTWRPGMADAPFNGGVIAIGEGEAGARFFDRALECYAALASDRALAGHFPRPLAAWWGDQFALALVVGHRAFAERSADALDVDGVRVRFLPCEDFNFTLEAGQAYDPAVLRRKRFVHFKGNRKALQAGYLEHLRAGRL